MTCRIPFVLLFLTTLGCGAAAKNATPEPAAPTTSATAATASTSEPQKPFIPKTMPLELDALLDKMSDPKAVTHLHAYLTHETCFLPLNGAEAARTMPEDTSVSSVGQAAPPHATIGNPSPAALGALEQWIDKQVPDKKNGVMRYGRTNDESGQTAGWLAVCLEPTELLAAKDLVPRKAKRPTELAVGLTPDAKRRLHAAPSGREIVFLIDDDLAAAAPVDALQTLTDPVLTFPKHAGKK